jgi:hypothetical protein
MKQDYVEVEELEIKVHVVDQNGWKDVNKRAEIVV